MAKFLMAKSALACAEKHDIKLSRFGEHNGDRSGHYFVEAEAQDQVSTLLSGRRLAAYSNRPTAASAIIMIKWLAAYRSAAKELQA